MEERVPPATTDEPSDDTHWPQRALSLSLSVSRNQRPRPPLQPSSAVELETYIVQYPKDQIYRVPPPEHAIIVERHRNPAKKERPCCNRIMWVVIGLLALAAILTITFVSLSHAYNPKTPIFTITGASIATKNAKSSSKNPGYEITLKAKNQNDNMGVAYSSDDNGCVLLYKKEEFGTGKFPELNQESNESSNVVVLLDGTKKTLPDEIQESSQPSSLALNMNLKVKFNAGVLRMWSKNLNVACIFKVSALTKTGSKILSQQCKVD